MTIAAERIEPAGGAADRASHRLLRRQAVLAAFMALALACYCAPWLSGGSAALSMNGYDLAEWASLMPGVRYGAQPMVTPGLLRAPLIFAAALAALLPARRGAALWWLCGAGALLLAAALLPPFEYFLDSDWRGDVNYGQQTTFALLALFDAAVCWAMPRGWPRRAALVVFALAGAGAALAGVTQAVALAAPYSFGASIGAGAVGYVAAMAGVGLTAALPSRRANGTRGQSETARADGRGIG